MTRTEKQHKLANAIREYRGLYHAGSKAWIHAIDNFPSLDAFHHWMKSIDQPAVIGA